MSGFSKALMYLRNTASFSTIKEFLLESNSLKKCEELVKNDGYNKDFDFTQDGYLTKEDYNHLYNLIYGKYDNRPYKVDVTSYIQTKLFFEKGEYNPDYDVFGTEGKITENSLTTMLIWLLFGKLPNAFD